MIERKRTTLAIADQREATDDRFDQGLPLAIESATLAANRYLLRRDTFLFVSDVTEKRCPGTRDKRMSELRAAQYHLTVQLEHVTNILKQGKL